MKIDTFNTETFETANPLDIFEDQCHELEWGYHRFADDAMAVECPGMWGDYHLVLQWIDDTQTLGIHVGMNAFCEKKMRPKVYELLNEANEHLWLGCFLVVPEGDILYRHTLLLQGSDETIATVITQGVETAIQECDRFYPSFQFVLWGGKSPKEALAAALLQTEGEA
jgi:hypothetical protein